MQAKTLSPDLTVAAQILPEEVALIAAAGFKSILCNRPDGEDQGQPDFAVIKARAEALGLATAHQPVLSGMIDEADAEAFAAHLKALPKPVFAYCRSGTRCSMLWSLAQELAQDDQNG